MQRSDAVSDHAFVPESIPVEAVEEEAKPETPGPNSGMMSLAFHTNNNPPPTSSNSLGTLSTPTDGQTSLLSSAQSTPPEGNGLGNSGENTTNNNNPTTTSTEGSPAADPNVATTGGAPGGDEEAVQAFEDCPPSPTAPRAPVRKVVPAHARCEFCQKYDSVCSYCHFRWRNLQQTSNTNLQKTYGVKLDPKERWRVAATTIVSSDRVEWIKFMIESKTLDVDAMANFVPLTTDDVVVGGRWGRSVGGVDGVIFTTLLHIAAAYNRLEIAKLLISSGAYFRKDSAGEVPTAYSSELPDSSFWGDTWTSFPLYQRYVKMERARIARKEEQHQTALDLYEGIIQEFPTYEHAVCSKAKTMIEARHFSNCWAYLAAVEKNKYNIKWIELDASMITVLRKECQRQYHAHVHAIETPCMKSCGCIILDDVKVPIRKLRFSIVRHILSFVDCEGVFYCSRAMPKCKLWTSACERPPHQLDDTLLRVLFQQGDARAKALHNKLVSDFQKYVGKEQMTGDATIRIQMADAVYHAYIIIVFVRVSMITPTQGKGKASGSSGGGSSNNVLVQLPTYAKQFNIFREKDEDEWFVSSAGEWEVVEVVK
eukprot:PhF_6_TR27213/c0_g1_i6/m.40051